MAAEQWMQAIEVAIQTADQKLTEALKTAEDKIVRQLGEHQNVMERMSGKITEHDNGMNTMNERMNAKITEYDNAMNIMSDQMNRWRAETNFKMDIIGEKSAAHAKEKGKKSMLDAKTMQPDKLNGSEKFSTWREDVEDYCESIEPGMRTAMTWARKQKKEVNKYEFEDEFSDVDFEKGVELYQLLKTKTEGEARRIVRGVRDANGWEAWRSLHSTFEPKTLVTRGALRADIAALIKSPAKKRSEVRQIIGKLEDKIKKFEDHAGMIFDEEEKKGYAINLLDEDTRRHMIQYGGDEFGYAEYKDKVLEFVNMMTNANESMDIDHMQQHNKDQYQCQWSPKENDEWQIPEQGEAWQDQENSGNEYHIDALGQKGYGKSGKGYGKNGKSGVETRTCFECGQVGHLGRDCPSKGKGKGKGKSGDYNKGYGNYGKGYGKSYGKSGDYGKGYGNYGKGYGDYGKGYGNYGKGYQPEAGQANCLTERLSSLTTVATTMPAKEWTPVNRLTNVKQFTPRTSVIKGEKETGTKMVGILKTSNRFGPLVQGGEDIMDDEIDEKFQRKTTPNRSHAKDEHAVSQKKITDKNKDHKIDHEFPAIKDTMGSEKRAKVRIRPQTTPQPQLRTNTTTTTTTHTTTTPPQLNTLQEIRKEVLNSAEEKEWKKLTITIDSGASETVIPSDECKNIPTMPSAGSMRKTEYEVASGHKIANEGQKVLNVLTNEYSGKKITMQVCKVNKALMSVSKICDAGNVVIFDKDWSYIMNKETCQRTTIDQAGGVYKIDVWVNPDSGKDQDFTRHANQ